jgi:hypothetical protein
MIPFESLTEQRQNRTSLTSVRNTKLHYLFQVIQPFYPTVSRMNPFTHTGTHIKGLLQYYAPIHALGCLFLFFLQLFGI